MVAERVPLDVSELMHILGEGFEQKTEKVGKNQLDEMDFAYLRTLFLALDNAQPSAIQNSEVFRRVLNRYCGHIISGCSHRMDA